MADIEFNMTPRKIKLLDSNFNDGTGWQPGVSLLVEPRLVKWDRKDAKEWGGAVVLTDSHLNSSVKAARKIAWLVESPDVSPQIYDPAIVDYSKFHRVITFKRSLLESLPNAVEGLMGGCHIAEDEIRLHRKTQLVSMVASTKSSTEGHKFRCRTANALAGAVEMFGKGRARQIANKADGLREFAFSVAVENSQVPDYFSEKLIDCFLTGTIPVYWGTPAIANHFNMDGVIVFNDEREAVAEVGRLTVDKYVKKLAAVADNFRLAQRFVCPEDDMERRGYFQ